MAYGNWGAFVYKNGERQKTHEDNTPYKETELEAGYWQAFGPRDGLGPHHAVLGEGDFRLCGYKCYPRIYYKGEPVESFQYRLNPKDGETEAEWYFEESEGIEGEIAGYTFSAYPAGDNNEIDLSVTCPNGDKWTSRCGYCIGAGHEY